LVKKYVKGKNMAKRAKVPKIPAKGKPTTKAKVLKKGQLRRRSK
jgi:hypothetical protein